MRRSLLLLVLLLGVGCKKKSEPAGDTAPPAGVSAPAAEPPPADATLHEIGGAYADNELAAEKKYKGRRFRLTIEVLNVQRAKSGRLHVLAPYDCNGVKLVAGIVPRADEESALETLKPGQRVTVEAICHGILGRSDGTNPVLVFREAHFIPGE